MKIVSITDAKNRLSALIDGLRGGSRALIVDRGRPVARLEPVTGGKDEQDGRIARLVREGVMRPASARMPQSLLTEQPPRMKSGASAVAVLIEERRDGR
jgi:antitoxin (DNA-binding transcriptional repressor) of toxin-antitoxin stability system